MSLRLEPRGWGGDEQTNERTNEWTNERTNESPPVFYRTSSPSGPLPKNYHSRHYWPFTDALSSSDGTGIGDCIQRGARDVAGDKVRRGGASATFSGDCGPVSTRSNRVLKGPLSRSLRSFARTAHSAYLLRSAPLCYARFTPSLHSRARSLTSLTPSWDS